MYYMIYSQLKNYIYEVNADYEFYVAQPNPLLDS